MHCTHVYICAHECTYVRTYVCMGIHMDALYNVISVLKSVQISWLETNKVDYSIQLSHSLCGAVILATCFCCSMTMLVTTCMVVCDLYFVAKSIPCMFAYMSFVLQCIGQYKWYVRAYVHTEIFLLPFIPLPPGVHYSCVRDPHLK